MKIEFCPYCNRLHFRPKVTERPHIEFEYYLEFYYCECRQFFFRWNLANWKLYSEITTMEFALPSDLEFLQAIRNVLRLEHAYLNAIWKHAQENPIKVPFEDASFEEMKKAFDELSDEDVVHVKVKSVQRIN